MERPGRVQTGQQCIEEAVVFKFIQQQEDHPPIRAIDIQKPA
jgi:hypothetical protein